MSSRGLPSWTLPFRAPFYGATDTIRDMDVELASGRVYAACTSGDVFIWDATTQLPVARLRHPFWANAVRCFPRRDAKPSSPPSRAQLILTGCEDGVLSAWCPVTFRQTCTVRPGFGAITHLHLPSGAASTTCCAASLNEIFVMHVALETSSAPLQLHVLQSLSHAATCTAVASWGSLSSSPSLAVGLANGHIFVWSLQDWSYSHVLPFPPREGDIDEDAAQIQRVHTPAHVAGKLTKTFAFNNRRWANPNTLGYPEEGMPEEDDYVASVSPAPYESNAHDANSKDPALQSCELTYDTRAVTCMAVSRQRHGLSTRLVVGHATGDLFLWGSLQRGFPLMLLKRLRLFAPTRWVWHVTAVDTAVLGAAPGVSEEPPAPASPPPSDAAGEDGASSPLATSPVSRPAKPAKKKRLLTKAPSSPRHGGDGAVDHPLEFIVWSDVGEIKYLSAQHSIGVCDGPGFLATAACSWTTSGVDGKLYVAMGGHDGRAERFEVSAVAAKLQQG